MRDESFWLGEWTRLEAGTRAVWAAETETPNGAQLCWRDARTALPAYLDMYEADSDTRYLDVFVQRANQILEYAKITDGYPGWPSTRDGVTEEWAMHDMAIGGTLLRFVNIAAGLPQYDSSTAFYKMIGAQIAKKWAGHWRQIDDRAGVYIRNGGTYVNNGLALAGIFHWEMGDHERANMIAEALRRVMRPHPNIPGAVIWNYATEMLPGLPALASPEVDDINHAGPMVSFAILAMRDKLRAIRASVLGLWNGSADAPVFKWRMDGTGDLAAGDLPYYRHMELGSTMYPAIEAMYVHLARASKLTRSPGTYLSIPSLVLRYQFP